MCEGLAGAPNLQYGAQRIRLKFDVSMFPVIGWLFLSGRYCMCPKSSSLDVRQLNSEHILLFNAFEVKLLAEPRVLGTTGAAGAKPR